MSLRKALVALPAGAMIAAAALAPVATSAHSVKKHHAAKTVHKKKHHRTTRAHAAGGATNCTGVQATDVSGDLNVPSNKTCTINAGVTIGGAVYVNSGATLIDKGATIYHDLIGYSPKGIGVGGSTSGSVGGNLNINGTSGAGPGTAGNNFVCNTTVRGDLYVTSSTSTAGPWIIGDIDEQCSGGSVTVGGDTNVKYNKDRVDVADNMKGRPPYVGGGLGHDLNVLGNTVTLTSPVVESNFVGGNANCQSGTKKDSDGSPNYVQGSNSCG